MFGGLNDSLHWKYVAHNKCSKIMSSYHHPKSCFRSQTVIQRHKTGIESLFPLDNVKSHFQVKMQENISKGSMTLGKLGAWVLAPLLSLADLKQLTQFSIFPFFLPCLLKSGEYAKESNTAIVSKSLLLPANVTKCKPI